VVEILTISAIQVRFLSFPFLEVRWTDSAKYAGSPSCRQWCINMHSQKLIRSEMERYSACWKLIVLRYELHQWKPHALCREVVLIIILRLFDLSVATLHNREHIASNTYSLN